MSAITSSARASTVGGIALQRRLLPAMPLMPLELLDADQYAGRSLHLSVSELEVPLRGKTMPTKHKSEGEAA